MRYAARKRRLTPPAFRYKLIEAARAAQKRIVLPEGEKTRTIMAARICARKGIARPVLIGNPQRIAAVAQSRVWCAIDEIEVIDHNAVFERYVASLVEMRKHRGSLNQPQNQLSQIVGPGEP